MKQLFVVVLCGLMTLPLGGQALSYIDKDGKKQLWGLMDPEELLSADFDGWRAAYDQFEPVLPATPIKDSLMQVEVDVYLGTWCGDSQMWAPRFLKLWAALGLPLSRVRLIGLHQDDDRYKQGPAHEEAGLHIHRVPTFIFKRNGVEFARIVERPLNTLETDVAQLALGVPSMPRYRAADYLNDQLAQMPLDSLYAHSRSILRAISREVSTISELNTYGYVLKAAGKLREAQFVFQINAALFRFDPNAHDSLGEICYALGNYEGAKVCYQRVLELKPDDENAAAMLAKLEQTTPVDAPEH